MKLFRSFVRKCVRMNRKLSTDVIMIRHNLARNNEHLEPATKKNNVLYNNNNKKYIYKETKKERN